MELIGRIYKRKIYYLKVRNSVHWKTALPKKDWLAFTIANKEDEELIASAVPAFLDRNVSYTCSAGEIAHRSEDYFDEEIEWRAADHEMRTKEEFDYNYSPVTTAHRNFGEGFWFATVLARDDFLEIDRVVCLDFTSRGVKNHLVDLIDRINSGWLPTNKKIELPEYDN